MALPCSWFSCGSDSGQYWIKAIWVLPFCYVLRIIALTISASLTILFLMGGILAGCVAGAFVGWISSSGIIRSVIVVAIAGAAISLELLEAMRSYWLLGQPGLDSSSSMVRTADFLQQLLHDRFVNEQMDQLQLATLGTYDLQLSGPTTSLGERTEHPGDVASPGLSIDLLKKLPCHILSYEAKTAQETCCTICLQDIAVGDIARCLPQCKHTFHLKCVDKWLVMHSSCPVCRQDVLSFITALSTLYNLGKT